MASIALGVAIQFVHTGSVEDCQKIGTFEKASDTWKSATLKGAMLIIRFGFKSNVVSMFKWMFAK